ncbi:thioesterase II family protein [Nocardiopsis alkaliphila]|uniref:thioesterase II family protein n=1 Tax=Nocardiopsis alkaliphila TaxID=225762 RepID=UPI001EF9FBB4|nr:alpha/beta fold hydrolase [Nocardiopsis alkaliphila]
MAESLWIRRSVRSFPRLRLVCLPFAGGGASVFQALPGLLPEAVEIVAVQLPGREERSREDPPARLDRLVRAIAIALRPYQDLPLAFYGHCAGGLLAYELASHMGAEQDVWPRRLVVGAQPAPGSPIPGAHLHELSDRELIDAVAGRGGLPEAVVGNTALIEFLLPLLRSDFALWERYEHRPRPPLPVPINVLRGRDDPLVGKAEVEGWREHTTAGVTEATVDGGHYFINDLTDESARVLTNALLPD